MLYREVQIKDIDEIIQIWNSSIFQDNIDKAQLVKYVFCDENYDPRYFQVALDKDKVVGFILGMKRKYPYWERGLQEGQAWIMAMAVDSYYRRQGIGGELLRRLEDHWSKEGVNRIALGTYSPHYFFSGVWEGYEEAAQFFASKGFKKGEAAYWMSRSLKGYSIPEDILERKKQKENTGYSFVTFNWNYAVDLIEFMKENFSVGWRRHLIEAMKNDRAEDTVILCLYKDKIIGYVQRSIDGNPSRFGPFGVAENFRSGGLGAILIHEMWSSMTEKKIPYVFFKSTEEKGRRFYERQGMQVDRIFYHYEMVKDVSIL
jgi:ribosomal protein S18 acetylase RimI-like enzyme